MDKKIEILRELFNRMLLTGWLVTPSYLNGDKCVTITEDPDIGNRHCRISLDDLNTVKVVMTYHAIEYDNTLFQRRNAIKTGKDIFDFYTELRCKRYENISKKVQDEPVPNIALYYANNATNDRVVITSTRRYALTEFVMSGDNFLLAHSKDLDAFTKLIAMDRDNGGDAMRWDKPVSVDRQWWRH